MQPWDRELICLCHDLLIAGAFLLHVNVLGSTESHDLPLFWDSSGRLLGALVWRRMLLSEEACQASPCHAFHGGHLSLPISPLLFSLLMKFPSRCSSEPSLSIWGPTRLSSPPCIVFEKFSLLLGACPWSWWSLIITSVILKELFYADTLPLFLLPFSGSVV